MPAEFGFDGDAARQLEAIYLTADIVAQREAVVALLGAGPGDRVLDVGSGPGMLAAAVGAVVGPSGFVCGTDLSASMAVIARRRCGELGNVVFHVGGAEALPYRDAGFDRAACTQVLEFVRDPAAALAELHRVLRPGGRLLLMDTDWESCVWASGDDARMRRMLDAWDAHCPHPKLPRVLAPMLAAAGFELAGVEVVPLVTAVHKAGTYSEGMIGTIARYVGKRGTLPKAEISAWQADLESIDAEGRYFFSLNRHVFLAVR